MDLPKAVWHRKETHRTSRETLFAIHKYIVDYINTIDYEYKVKPDSRNISEIFNSSYGNSLEKSLLLISMLAYKDIEAIKLGLLNSVTWFFDESLIKAPQSQ